MLKAFGSFIIFLAILIVPRSALAAYVLPYPSFMPGHRLYRVSRIIDEAKRYWYWGNLSSYRYHLEQSDAALVEAKTLYEYRQYLLAGKALEQSNSFFLETSKYLTLASQEGKDVTRWRMQLRDAGEKHGGVLKKLRSELPAIFVWRPERENSIVLQIQEGLRNALQLRESAVDL